MVSSLLASAIYSADDRTIVKPRHRSKERSKAEAQYDAKTGHRVASLDIMQGIAMVTDLQASSLDQTQAVQLASIGKPLSICHICCTACVELSAEVCPSPRSSLNVLAVSRPV